MDEKVTYLEYDSLQGAVQYKEGKRGPLRAFPYVANSKRRTIERKRSGVAREREA